MVNDKHLDPNALVGEWNFERRIVDRRAEVTKRVTGTTTIEDAGDGRLRWYESGTLFDGDLELPVFRTLFIEQHDGEWAVTFEDGREFHDWAPGDDVEHLCGADTYRGRIDIDVEEATTDSQAAWSVEWTVTGPSKDYTMTTHLARSS
ncbi:hypothetical protein CJ178_10805 [Rhodococcus sp. ACPA4]|uniref:Uncharacterized protein n=1 Tax=Nocardia globerula TaxID=1818 RepID=A0A652YX80_NOCGL|nr:MULTISPECIES: DUF6314 family protein [Rhodococcus]NMD59449.1 hypothetical protein [Nocardia globerula]PBC42019.1 hypothetical protein CJ178_10805 [Rhodococcus sp. ACPA4]PVX64479.1 hypothetical protein C8E04_1757 [Rhodococcus globerulus]